MTDLLNRSLGDSFTPQYKTAPNATVVSNSDVLFTSDPSTGSHTAYSKPNRPGTGFRQNAQNVTGASAHQSSTSSLTSPSHSHSADDSFSRFFESSPTYSREPETSSVPSNSSIFESAGASSFSSPQDDNSLNTPKHATPSASEGETSIDQLLNGVIGSTVKKVKQDNSKQANQSPATESTGQVKTKANAQSQKPTPSNTAKTHSKTNSTANSSSQAKPTKSKPIPGVDTTSDSSKVSKNKGLFTPTQKKILIGTAFATVMSVLTLALLSPSSKSASSPTVSPQPEQLVASQKVDDLKTAKESSPTVTEASNKEVDVGFTVQKKEAPPKPREETVAKTELDQLKEQLKETRQALLDVLEAQKQLQKRVEEQNQESDTKATSVKLSSLNKTSLTPDLIAALRAGTVKAAGGGFVPVSNSLDQVNAVSQISETLVNADTKLLQQQTATNNAISQLRESELKLNPTPELKNPVVDVSYDGESQKIEGTNLDPKFLLKAGTEISCTLTQSIDTAEPKTVNCNVNKDVYSADLKTVLIPAGSVATGAYRGVQANAGEGKSVNIVWTHITYPDHIRRVNLGSATTVHGTGGSGVPADIDQHFAKNFALAVFASVVSDAVGYGARSLQNSTVGTTTNCTVNGVATQCPTGQPVFTASNTQKALVDGIQRYINDSTQLPEVRVLPGTSLNIITNIDINFSNFPLN